jgi:DNA-binding response OmpR family regulator
MHPVTAPSIVVSDLKFDLNTLEAERAGQPIKLNPTTRRLLSILMQNTHRVVTREELEKTIWGNDTPEADVLRAHMHTLRSAIDKGFSPRLLHTLHGTGYRLFVDPDDAT